jgi:hypothetical protein
LSPAKWNEALFSLQSMITESSSSSLACRQDHVKPLTDAALAFFIVWNLWEPFWCTLLDKFPYLDFAGEVPVFSRKKWSTPQADGLGRVLSHFRIREKYCSFPRFSLGYMPLTLTVSATEYNLTRTEIICSNMDPTERYHNVSHHFLMDERACPVRTGDASLLGGTNCTCWEGGRAARATFSLHSR